MKRHIVVLSLFCCLLAVGVAYAATMHHMKCKDKACGYEARVQLGPTMQTNSITGFCRNCETFVSLSWRYRNIREPGKDLGKKPEAMGEIWDAKAGKILPVYACPTCKGPFAEVKKHADLTHCPKCNKPGFSIDNSKPPIAVD